MNFDEDIQPVSHGETDEKKSADEKLSIKPTQDFENERHSFKTTEDFEDEGHSNKTTEDLENERLSFKNTEDIEDDRYSNKTTEDFDDERLSNKMTDGFEDEEGSNKIKEDYEEGTNDRKEEEEFADGSDEDEGTTGTEKVSQIDSSQKSDSGTHSKTISSSGTENLLRDEKAIPLDNIPQYITNESANQKKSVQSRYLMKDEKAEKHVGLKTDSFEYKTWSSLTTVYSQNPSLITKHHSFADFIIKYKFEITELFLDTCCRKTSDGTKELILLGADLYRRIRRRLNDQDLKYICDFLRKRTQVVHLNLAYNEISSAGLRSHLCPFLKVNRRLKRLNLANNHIDASGIKLLALCGPHIKLDELRLNGNKFGPKGGNALSIFLGLNNRLKVLDLGQTDQNLSSLCCLTVRMRPDYIPGGVYNVTDADESIKYHDAPVEASHSKMTGISQMTQITTNASMESSVFLSGEPQKMSLMSIGQDDLKPNSTLEVLIMDRVLGHFYYQPLTSQFASLVSNMIRVNKCLVEFHFEKNSLTDQDIEILVNGLKENTTLRLLNLASNRINDHGAELLAACLPNTGLEAIILNHNSIRDSGASEIGYHLPSTKIRFLDLANNKITDGGMMEILYTLKKTPPFVALFIWGNQITHQSLLKVKEYLTIGILLQEALDIKIYEVDEVLQHGHFPIADRYKPRYYSCNKPRDPSKIVIPPNPTDPPLKFLNHNPVYPRKILTSIPAKFNKMFSGTCTF